MTHHARRSRGSTHTPRRHTTFLFPLGSALGQEVNPVTCRPCLLSSSGWLQAKKKKGLVLTFLEFSYIDFPFFFLFYRRVTDTTKGFLVMVMLPNSTASSSPPWRCTLKRTCQFIRYTSDCECILAQLNPILIV